MVVDDYDRILLLLYMNSTPRACFSAILFIYAAPRTSEQKNELQEWKRKKRITTLKKD
jgi:hypothetical protein